MADVQGLESLHDIQLPALPGWWPLAIGWYLLAALLLAALLALGGLLYRRRRRERFKRQALHLLSQYEAQFQREKKTQDVSAAVSNLLRRLALLYYPREEVASLQGAAWIDFLNRSSDRIDFSALTVLLLELPYRPDSADDDLGPLFAAARAWIQQRGTPCSN